MNIKDEEERIQADVYGNERSVLLSSRIDFIVKSRRLEIIDREINQPSEIIRTESTPAVFTRSPISQTKSKLIRSKYKNLVALGQITTMKFIKSPKQKSRFSYGAIFQANKGECNKNIRIDLELQNSLTKAFVSKGYLSHRKKSTGDSHNTKTETPLIARRNVFIDSLTKIDKTIKTQRNYDNKTYCLISERRSNKRPNLHRTLHSPKLPPYKALNIHRKHFSPHALTFGALPHSPNNSTASLNSPHLIFSQLSN